MAKKELTYAQHMQKALHYERLAGTCKPNSVSADEYMRKSAEHERKATMLRIEQQAR